MSSRPDFIFSYWIIIWYFLYIAKITMYNPKFVFILALCFSVVQISIMFQYKKSAKYIAAFVIANILIKVIPLFTIWKTKTHINDVYFFFGLVVIYICWLKINDINLRDHFIDYITPSNVARQKFLISRTIYKSI